MTTQLTAKKRANPHAELCAWANGLRPDSPSSKEERVCKTCGHRLHYVDCWNCGGEIYVDHDCGEDVCCCAYPEDNIRCDICDGKGGFHSCIKCHPETFDEQ